MQNSSIVTSLYNSRKTLLEQLGQQDYNTDSYMNFGINEVNIMYSNSAMDMILEKPSGERVYVRYFSGKMVRPANIRELVDDIITNDTIKGTDTIIFVTMDDVNDTIREFVKQIWEEEKIFVITLSVKRLQYNVLQHEIVPKHEIMSKGVVAAIMEIYKMRDTSLFPEISRFDPIAMAIGMRPTDVCKITRPSKTAVVSTYYRLCVNN